MMIWYEYVTIIWTMNLFISILDSSYTAYLFQRRGNNNNVNNVDSIVCYKHENIRHDPVEQGKYHISWISHSKQVSDQIIVTDQSDLYHYNLASEDYIFE